MIGSKIDHHRLPCREEAPDVEKSSFALPVPKHEAALGVTSHRSILESIVVEATLIGSRNRPNRPLADVVPAVSVHAVDDYGAITSLCKVGLDRPIATASTTDEHGMVAFDNVV